MGWRPPLGNSGSATDRDRKFEKLLYPFLILVLSDARLSRVPVFSWYEPLTAIGSVIHHTLRDTEQNMADMISLNTCHDNDEANKRRFLLAHNLQPATRDLSGVEPHRSPLYRRSQELKFNPPKGNPLERSLHPKVPQVTTPGSEHSDQSRPTSSLSNGFSSDVTTASNDQSHSTSSYGFSSNVTTSSNDQSRSTSSNSFSSDASSTLLLTTASNDQSRSTSSSSSCFSPDVTTASNAGDVAGAAQETTVQRAILEASPQNQEQATSASPASSHKGAAEPSRDNGLIGLKELLSSMDIPQSILKTKITSLLMSDKGNDLTISDILTKIMELRKTNDELSSETETSTPDNVNTSGAPNCSKNTNESPGKRNDNTELIKLLFANRSVVPPIDHPERALHFYPSVTPSQILTGPPLLKGRGRPPNQRAFRPVLPQHQAIINGNTPEPNPPMMPTPCGVREYRTNLPTENGTVPNYPVLPSAQIAQTTTCGNNAMYPAVPPQYRQYPDEYCPDGAVLMNEMSIPAVTDAMNNVPPPNYGLPNPDQTLVTQDLSRPLDSFHRPGAGGAAFNYSVRHHTHQCLPQNNHANPERTINRKSSGGDTGTGSPRSRSRPSMSELLKRVLEDTLDGVPAKRSKLSDNIPHLEKYNNECNSSTGDNSNKGQNGNSFKKFEFATEELICQLLISTIESELDEKLKGKERRMKDKHTEKSGTPYSHEGDVIYEKNDDNYDLPTLVDLTDEPGNALDLTNHCSDSDVSVVGEECGALDLTYKNVDVKPLIVYESSWTNKVTLDKHLPSMNPGVSPGHEFYSQRRRPVMEPAQVTAGTSLPIIPLGPGHPTRPAPTSAEMPCDIPPAPPPPPPMHGNGSIYPLHHPGCTGNQDQQRCGYFYQPPPQQQQQQQQQHPQQHSPTCCRLRQQQCFPWNQQAPFRGPFPVPAPRNVPPGNPRPPRAYSSMLSMRQPPPNVTVCNNVPRNQHHMSYPMRYAQPPGPQNNSPRPMNHQQGPTLHGKTYQYSPHRGTSLGHLSPFLNNNNINNNGATQFQFAARSSANVSRDANNNDATRYTSYPGTELPANSPSRPRQILHTQIAQPTPARSNLLKEYLTTANSSPNIPPPFSVEACTSGYPAMKRNRKFPPNDRTTQSPSTSQSPPDRENTNSAPLPSNETTSSGPMTCGRSKSADARLMSCDVKEKSPNDRNHRPTCLDAIHSIIDGCFYNDDDDSENHKRKVIKSL